MKAYSLLFAVGCLSIVAGVLSLVTFFSGQVREGYAPQWQLWVGIGSLFVGVVFAALGDMGRRIICAKEPSKPTTEDSRQGVERGNR